MIRLTFTGQPSNMGEIQEFENQKALDSWLEEHGENGSKLLKVASKTAKKLTFEGGSATIETV